MHAVVFASSSFTGYIFVTRELDSEIIEAGLQMSYNLCNLPKQITAANGTSVKYSYFADGTKFKAVNAAGNGFVYTGSLRWSVENGTLTPESVAITGGRAVYSSNGWAANYYITDHLGSVRAVTDADGEVLDTYDYMPYGSEFTSDTDNITDYRFTGKEKQTAFGNSNIYDSFARFQNTYGRFMSIDPKAESFYHISPYTYCAGDPVNLVDPDGKYIVVYDNRIRYDWQKHNGSWGLYDYDGNKYSGSNKFINQVGSALNEIMASGETGYNLIETLSNHREVFRIYNLNDVRSDEYTETCFSNTHIVWNIDTPESVPTTTGSSSNAVVNLGHELAHAQYKHVLNGKNKRWFRISTWDKDKERYIDEPVKRSEIHTTHIENVLRANMGLPLRTHYAIDENGEGIGKPIIHPETRASIYYDAYGHTNYKRLRKDTPFIYK